jgi:hypothetical protein
MSDTLLSTWFELPDGLDSSEISTVLPVANSDIEYAAGVKIKPTDMEIEGDGGAYFVRLQPNISYPSSPPVEGLASLVVHFYFPDGAGGETVIQACGVEVNALHEAEGLGDYPFVFAGEMVKLNLFIAPAPGRFVLEAMQNTGEDPMAYTGNLQIVKI